MSVQLVWLIEYGSLGVGVCDQTKKLYLYTLYHIYIYSMCICKYIYIYIERERDRGTTTDFSYQVSRPQSYIFSSSGGWG